MQEERINKIAEALFQYSASVIKDGILQYASIEELFELSLYSHERTAFRAAWALEHVLLGNSKKQSIQDYTDKILDIYCQSENWSVLRSISKVVMELLTILDIKTLTENQTEDIINKTFNCLENSDCPVAVRCNMYDILFLFIKENSWLTTELYHRMQLDLSINDTAAIRSRSQRLMKKLERISKS